MRNRGYLWLTLGVVLLAAVACWAQGGGRPPMGGGPGGQGGPGGMGGMRGGFMREHPFFTDLTTVMTLTTPDAKTLSGLQSQAQEEMKKHFESLRTKQEAVNDALKADKIDMNKVKKLVAAVSQEQTAMQLDMVQNYIKLKAAVPADQRGKLPELSLYPRRGMGLGGMRGGMGGPGGPGGTPPAGAQKNRGSQRKPTAGK